MKGVIIATAAAVLLTPPVSAGAQGAMLGATAFKDHCAVCHGDTGKGDGVVGALFAQRPKDLTQLSKENGGTFPMDRVVGSIDGRDKIAGHGLTASRMPVWGSYFLQQGVQAQGLTPDLAAEVVQGRILTLAYYLESIQAR
ncbi:MAG: c-type cytochrome [Paracoccaceae bacterium]|nr:c-type cytochrome [Paracoccaceae bacterium]MDE3239730.1 c-type cytochrome [Paracoccaceae bacterium]